MATIKVKQVKSRIKCPKDQKRTLDALGLRKMKPEHPSVRQNQTYFEHKLKHPAEGQPSAL